jgi:hypothetical protein
MPARLRLAIGRTKPPALVLIAIPKTYPANHKRKIMNTIDTSSDNRPIRSVAAKRLDTITLGAVAGAAGGLAEIAWVALYALATGASPALLARGVTTAAGMSALFPADTVALGIGIHMGIAVMLGVALAFIWRATPASYAVNPFTFMAAALAGVWAFNFFVVLPIVSPAFIHFLPYSVSLISKLAFAMAAAGVLRLSAVPAVKLSTRAHRAPRAITLARLPSPPLNG